MDNNQLLELNNRIQNTFPDKELVFGNGSINSRLVLIGEAPGANEVKQKKPFVGQAGKHLNEFLEILKLKRENLYITNVVKFRPTKPSKKTNGEVNRPPSKIEIEEFKVFLYKEIEIVAPQFIVTLGNVPLQAVISSSSKIGELHGELIKTQFNDKTYNVFPLYHPAAVIYNRSLREVYLEDLKSLNKVLNN